MLEMTILETQIFNIFWESITPDILRTVAPTALVVPPTPPTPPPPFENPTSAPVYL